MCKKKKSRKNVKILSVFKCKKHFCVRVTFLLGKKKSEMYRRGGRARQETDKKLYREITRSEESNTSKKKKKTKSNLYLCVNHFI